MIGFAKSPGRFMADSGGPQTCFCVVTGHIGGIMTNLNLITPAQLRRAADIQERILTLQSELNQILGAGPETAAPAATPKPGRRGLSPQGLANIRAGVAKRLANLKPTGATVATKTKRTMSAAWRAAIAAAARARWAKAKRAGKNRL